MCTDIGALLKKNLEEFSPCPGAVCSSNAVVLLDITIHKVINQNVLIILIIIGIPRIKLLDQSQVKKILLIILFELMFLALKITHNLCNFLQIYDVKYTI